MCILRGTCNSRGAYNRSDQQRRIPTEYLDYLGRIYFMVYRWTCYNLGGKGGEGGVGRAYKRQFTVFLIVIIEAIYTREPR